MTIQELITISTETEKSKQWPDRKPAEHLMLMVSELAEALEELRNDPNLTKVYYQENGKPEGFSVELADCVIRIAAFCGSHNLDLEKALHEKLKFNISRPIRHGGKLL